MTIATLVREFDRLSRTSQATVTAWGTRHPVLTDCHDLHDVAACVSRDPDAVLGGLLHEVRDGCVVAPLVVMRVLLPKIIVMAHRDRDGRIEDYLSQLWLRIADYPLERRPGRIAANLALDTLKAVRAERGRGVEVVGDLDRWPASACSRQDSHPDPRHILRTAMDLGLVDPRTHAVLVSVYAEGLSRTAAAERFRVTPRTIQRRCHRGLRVLAAHSRELADAL